MKTKTNFATTSDVRNLINATMETFPKGPERDGIQTKMFNFWDNLNAGNNLPAGSDRNRFIAESKDNLNAARRTAQRLDNEGNKGCDMKVTVLASKLTGIKVGKNEMAKVEDKFYGKRVVKGIFAKTWSGRSAKLNKYGDYAIVAADADGNAKTFTNRTQAQNFSDRNNLGGVKEPSGGGRSFFVYIKDPSSEEKKTLSRIGMKARFAKADMPQLRAEFVGFDVDSNGNKIARFRRYAGEIVRIQTNGNLPKSHSMTNNNFDAKAIEQEVLASSYASKFALKSKSSRTGSKAKFATNDPALANFLRKYKENEDRNYHSENILLLAKFVGSSDEVTQASMFVDLVKRMRGLPPEVKDEQYALHKRLAAKAKAKYPNTNFARQGSKTKFANEEIAKGLSKVLKANGFNAMASEVLSGSTDSETLRKYIRVLKSKMSPLYGHERPSVLLEEIEKRLASRTGAKAKFGWPKSKFDIGDYVAIVGGSSNSVGKVSYTNYVDNKVDGGWKYKVIFPNGTMTFNEGSLKLAKPSSAAVSLIQARQ